MKCIYIPAASWESPFESEKFWDFVCLEISVLHTHTRFASTWHSKLILWALFLFLLASNVTTDTSLLLFSYSQYVVCDCVFSLETFRIFLLSLVRISNIVNNCVQRLFFPLCMLFSHLILNQPHEVVDNYSHFTEVETMTQRD